MTHSTRLQFSTSLLAITALCAAFFAPLAHAQSIEFSAPVEIREGMTEVDVLLQSDNYEDGVLTIGGYEFVVNEYGHLELKDPELGFFRGFFCNVLGVMCGEPQVGDVELSQEDAKAVVVAHVIPSLEQEMIGDVGRVLPMIAYAYPDPIARGTTIKRHFFKNPPVNVTNDAWFFFIDLEPYAAYGHRVEYVLVDVMNGKVRRQRAFSPPVLHGRTHYLQFSEREDSPDRFYPRSTEDMPAPGSWPLEYESNTVPPTGDDPAAAEDALQERKDVSSLPAVQTLSLQDLVREQAYAQEDPSDPCAGKTPKRVAVLIAGEGPSTRHDDGYVDGRDMMRSTGDVLTMLRNLGFGTGDTHTYDPESHPKLEDVIKDIKNKIKGLGPCDKFFFYIVGHGTISDKDKDGKPDHPSSSIVYGHGDDSEYLNKGRYGTHNMWEFLKEVKAKTVNIMIESCYSGSFGTLVDDHFLNPPSGTTWNNFFASTPDKPSYGGGQGGGMRYTEALSYCVNLTLVQRGIKNPTIEQMEEIMKECQKKLADNPQTYLDPPSSTSVEHISITVTPEVHSVQEGDDGTVSATFIVTRGGLHRDVTLTYSTYVGKGNDHNATEDVDFSGIDDTKVSFPQFVTVVPITVTVFGDTFDEIDEWFYLWISELSELYRVTIIDDDDPTGTTSDDSSLQLDPPKPTGTSVTLPEQPVTDPGTSLDEFGKWYGGKINVDDGAVTIDLNFDYYDYSDFGYIDGTTEDGEWVVDPPTITIVCDPCEDEKKAVEEKEKECKKIDADLAEAKRDLGLVANKLSAANADVKAAEQDLKNFQNPQSWAESGGRRTDSTDLRVMEAHNRSLWSQYRSGDLTAQELEQRWRDGMSDAERQRQRERMEKDMKKKVENAKKNRDTLQKRYDEVKKNVDELEGKSKDCKKELEQLRKALEDCIKKCKDDETAIGITDYTEEGEEDDDIDDYEEDDEEEEDDSEEDDQEEDDDEEDEEEEATCPSPKMDQATCDASCEKPNICMHTFTLEDRTLCFECQSPKAECPTGTYSDIGPCERSCEDTDKGTCVRDKSVGRELKCYRCEEKSEAEEEKDPEIKIGEDPVSVSCPSGYETSCPSSCENGCDPVSEQGITCYKCKESCTSVCSQNGYVIGTTDFSSQILSELNGYTCVSGASISVTQSTIGGCGCMSEPSISIDSTSPTCEGTPCGDVACGTSTECQVGDTTYTVSCNWGGWKEVGELQFVPVIGQ